MTHGWELSSLSFVRAVRENEKSTFLTIAMTHLSYRHGCCPDTMTMKIVTKSDQKIIYT